MNNKGTSRRQFLKASIATLGFPAVYSFAQKVPTGAASRTSANSLINIAQIGCGRIARTMDMTGIMKHHDRARITAVCDLDSVRLADAKDLVESTYAKSVGSDKAMNVKTYRNYREMLQDPSIDAVAISTPDHWHALPA